MTCRKPFEPWLDYDWWGHVYDDFREVVGRMGFYNVEMQFSGFGCQGDGASFTGTFLPAKGIVKSVKGYAPSDETLHNIAERVAKLQKGNFYMLHGQVSRVGHRYCHENTVRAEYVRREHPHHAEQEAAGSTEDDLTEIVRDLCRWLYKSLEAEYEWQVADQAGRYCGEICAEYVTTGRAYISQLRHFRKIVAERHQAKRDSVPFTQTRAWVSGTARALHELRAEWFGLRDQYRSSLHEHKPFKGCRAGSADLSDAFAQGFSYGTERY